MTKTEIEIALDTGKLQCRWGNGKWYNVRRNGQTKLWKRNPERFAIPCKTGFRDFFTISTHWTGANLWLMPHDNNLRIKPEN